ncbi:MAG TPA: SRPBCC family protein [Fimbriimonadaceae bacterium]|jgi:uncharacterized protein YndB with AHSA1/START domain
MNSAVIHDTFTIERTLKASRERAFAVWSNKDLKARWFAGPADVWTPVKRELEFKVGGKETVLGSFSQGGSSHFDAVYMEIVDQTRIVYAYRMTVNGDLMSVSLTTVEFEDSGAGTRMKFTEQGAFFTGDAGDVKQRMVGSEMLVSNIARFLEEN